MGDDLRVTAAIPAYNAERYLSDAIESVLAQTHPCFEVIVVDDGSTDDTAQIARSYPEVRCLRQQNGGDANARNRAISETNGDLIAFLDADDLWLPEKIARQLDLFRSDPQLGMAYTGVTVVDSSLRPVETLPPAPGAKALRNTLLVEKPYMTGVGSSGLVRTEVAQRVRFDERLRASADWAFACNVALTETVASVSTPLVLYRQHSQSQVHLNLDAVEDDMTLVFSEIFDDDDLDAQLRRCSRRAHANLYLSLAASYFKRGDRGNFVRYLSRALVRRPDRVAAALWRRYLGPVQ